MPEGFLVSEAEGHGAAMSAGPSIETVEGFRRLGLAAMCVSYMIGVMGAEGLAPVWGAEQPNVASLALAGKLGFLPVGGIAVFHP